MNRTEQVNLNYKIAVKIMDWYSTKDNRWLRNDDAGFTGYFTALGETPMKRLIWDPCENAEHALMVWTSELMRMHETWIQVHKPGQFKAQIHILNDDDLLQKEQFYHIINENGDRWVEVIEEKAEWAICKAAEVIMDIMLCRKITREDNEF